MMMGMKYKDKGFTLIEMIVVLIIVGLLAAIAVPGYFSWVTRSRGSEALVIMQSLKIQHVLCLRMNPGNEVSCFPAPFCPMGIGGACVDITPMGGLSPNFSYWFFSYKIIPNGSGSFTLALPVNPQEWTMMAFYQGSMSLNFIAINGNANDSQTNCFAGGIFQGVC